MAWIAIVLVLPNFAHAQPLFGLSNRFELSAAVRVDEASTEAKAQLQQVDRLKSSGQWSEVVDSLRRVLESQGNKLIAAKTLGTANTRYRQYTPVREYCHRELASLPQEALDLYRNQVDAQAKRWYEEGLAARDPRLLQRVVDQAFVSNWGDQALLALGDMALEAGSYGQARSAWERIIETPPPRLDAVAFRKLRADPALAPEKAKLLDNWYREIDSPSAPVMVLRRERPIPQAEAQSISELLRRAGFPAHELHFPATDIPIADVLARLVLVSILEGDLDRARVELNGFPTEFADARGRLGGREVVFTEELKSLLADAAKWPSARRTSAWTTFAGAPERTAMAEAAPDVGRVAWRQPLAPAPPADENYTAYPSRRIAEGKTELLSYHPLVVGGKVLISGVDFVSAFNLKTGEPAWGTDPVIFRPSLTSEVRKLGGRTTLGTPRFTLTAYGTRLYARLGNPVTSSQADLPLRTEGSYLVCLDLSSEGKQVWQTEPLEDRWAYEGSPLCDGAHVYVAMRSGGVSPQSYVACLDAENGRQIWRQFIAAAETPTHGQADEVTHTLLTRSGDTLYISTNLGAVTALSASTGDLEWITCYPRADGGDLSQRATHFYRDLTPCVYYRGKLLVAPSDCELIFALDAATGDRLWDSSLPQDAIHLLGVDENRLWASGQHLWCLDVATGKVLQTWPDADSPKGFGRGVLAGGKVYFPTRGAIEVFESKTGARSGHIDLTMRSAEAGNLLSAEGHLVITTHNSIMALSDQVAPTSDTEKEAKPAKDGKVPSKPVPRKEEPPRAKPAEGK